MRSLITLLVSVVIVAAPAYNDNQREKIESNHLYARKDAITGSKQAAPKVTLDATKKPSELNGKLAQPKSKPIHNGNAKVKKAPGPKPSKLPISSGPDVEGAFVSEKNLLPSQQADGTVPTGFSTGNSEIDENYFGNASSLQTIKMILNTENTKFVFLAFISALSRDKTFQTTEVSKQVFGSMYNYIRSNEELSVESLRKLLDCSFQIFMNNSVGNGPLEYDLATATLESTISELPDLKEDMYQDLLMSVSSVLVSGNLYPANELPNLILNTIDPEGVNLEKTRPFAYILVGKLYREWQIYGKSHSPDNNPSASKTNQMGSGNVDNELTSAKTKPPSQMGGGNTENLMPKNFPPSSANRMSSVAPRRNAM